MLWPTKKLGKICKFEGGTQPPKSNFIFEPKEGYVRLLQIRDFKSDKFVTYIPDTVKLKKCADDDLMIGRYGASVGQILTGKSGAYCRLREGQEVLSGRALFAVVSIA